MEAAASADVPCGVHAVPAGRTSDMVDTDTAAFLTQHSEYMIDKIERDGKKNASQCKCCYSRV